MAHPLFEKHQTLLQRAVEAVRSRTYWSAYSENPKTYGENAIEEGRQAFMAYLDAQFYLDQPGVMGRVIAEPSPYGLNLDISFPRCAPDALIAAAKGAMPTWVRAGPDTRAAVCAEILERLNGRTMEIAHAVMHTTGQSLMMAFQTGGPHAQDRGLEALAQAWGEMKNVPEAVVGEKAQAPIRRWWWKSAIPWRRAESRCCSPAPRRRPGTAIRRCSPAWPRATR